MVILFQQPEILLQMGEFARQKLVSSTPRLAQPMRCDIAAVRGWHKIAFLDWANARILREFKCGSRLGSPIQQESRKVTQQRNRTGGRVERFYESPPPAARRASKQLFNSSNKTWRGSMSQRESDLGDI